MYSKEEDALSRICEGVTCTVPGTDYSADDAGTICYVCSEAQGFVYKRDAAGQRIAPGEDDPPWFCQRCNKAAAAKEAAKEAAKAARQAKKEKRTAPPPQSEERTPGRLDAAAALDSLAGPPRKSAVVAQENKAGSLARRPTDSPPPAKLLRAGTPPPPPLPAPPAGRSAAAERCDALFAAAGRGEAAPLATAAEQLDLTGEMSAAGDSLLHVAVRGGHVEAASLLASLVAPGSGLARPGGVCFENYAGDTPLRLAASAAADGLCRALMEAAGRVEGGFGKAMHSLLDAKRGAAAAEAAQLAQLERQLREREAELQGARGLLFESSAEARRLENKDKELAKRIRAREKEHAAELKKVEDAAAAKEAELKAENARLKAALQRAGSAAAVARPPAPLAAAAAAAAGGLQEEIRASVKARVASLRAGPADAFNAGRRQLQMAYHPDKAPCPPLRPLWNELSSYINVHLPAR